jgi:hypothetical protein
MRAYIDTSCRMLAVLLFFVTGLPSAHAQAPESGRGRPSRVPVTVALVERLPHPDAPFIILRRVTEGDYILLPVDADAALLTDAVNALLMARQWGGDRASADAVLRVRAPERVRGARPLPWVARVLTDLRSARPSAVLSVGQAPAVRIWLPRQTRAQATPPDRRG